MSTSNSMQNYQKINKSTLASEELWNNFMENSMRLKKFKRLVKNSNKDNTKNKGIFHLVDKCEKI